MPLIGLSVRLDRIDETLLYQAKDGSYWLSCVCSFDQDAKGRMVVAQSIPKERYAAGERGLAIGTWREIGQPKPPASGGSGFDLSKFKKPQAPNDGKYPQAEEGLFASPQAAFDVANGPQQEAKPAEPHGFEEIGF